MEPVVFQALQSRFTELNRCLAEGDDSFGRWKVSGHFLELFEWGLLPEVPALKEAWEAVRKVHYATSVAVFGIDSAEVSAALRQTFSSHFASCVTVPTAR